MTTPGEAMCTPAGSRLLSTACAPQHRLGTRNLRLHRWYISRSWSHCVLGACLLHMSLAFLEHPARLPPQATPRVNALNELILVRGDRLDYVCLCASARCCHESEEVTAGL